MVSDDIWWKFVVIIMKCDFMFFFWLKIEMKEEKKKKKMGIGCSVRRYYHLYISCQLA